MNDLMQTDDFERQVADVAQRVVGPPRTVDALAIARQATTDPPKRRFPSMFSALKFVAASAIVALFGAFLLAGILPSDSPEQAPPAAQTAEPTMELVTGWVNTEGTDRPAFETRMVVTLLDASNPGDDPVPLGEFILESAERLEAHAFAIEYDPDQIDEDGTYLVDMRLEQPASGQIISRAETQVPVITQGHPTKDVEIKLVVVEDPGPIGLVAGVVMADADVAELDGPARLVISLGRGRCRRLGHGTAGRVGRREHHPTATTALVLAGLRHRGHRPERYVPPAGTPRGRRDRSVARDRE